MHKSIVFTFMLPLLTLCVPQWQAVAQTKAGDRITFEAKAVWQYRSFPDSTMTRLADVIVVAGTPTLSLRFQPEAAAVAERETVAVRLIYKNVGDAQADSASLRCDIPAEGIRFVAPAATGTIAGGTISWRIDELGANDSGIVDFRVVVDSGTVPGAMITMNAAIQWLAKETTALSVLSVQRASIAPKYLTISAEPKYIYGLAGKDSSKITIIAKDSLRQNAPDGTRIDIATTLGTFVNGAKAVSVATTNGKAELFLRAATMTAQTLVAVVTAQAGIGPARVQASTEVLMYPGAITGRVMNGSAHAPFIGAIARVANEEGGVAGIDTTKADGRFFIPLNQTASRLHLRVFAEDMFGDTIVALATFDPSRFPNPALNIPNIISGRIQYRDNGQPVPAEGVVVHLDAVQGSASPVSGAFARMQGAAFHARETRTDARGRFTFGDLTPAVYRIFVDSTRAAGFAGTVTVADTIPGTFTLNVRLEVEKDSLITLQVAAKATASAGDTLVYGVTVRNSGNMLHVNGAVTDTLPVFSSFVSLRQGTFAAAAFDSSTGIVRWQIDTLGVNASDSASVTVVLSRNIPDKTVVRNAVWYASAREQPTLRSSVVTTVRSLPVLTFSSFFAGGGAIAAGDTVLKKIAYRNSGTDSLRGVRIVDTLYAASQSLLSFESMSIDSAAAIRDSIVTIALGSIAPGAADTITVRIITDPTLKKGSTIWSSTRLMQAQSTVDSAIARLTVGEHSNLASLLALEKTANKKMAEIGDIVTYQLQLNNSSTVRLFRLGVYDKLPHAFTYVKNSARYNGRALEPAMNRRENGLTWSVPDTLAAGGTSTIVYQLALDADALESEGMNTAYASAEAGGGTVIVSAASQWQVTVKAGVFTEKGLVIGKVFYDDNRNTFQEDGENGIKDVELWMEDGTRITTGDNGKFSIPEVKPGQHVIRVNERTLPAGAELMPGLHDFANDPVSRFVHITTSGIAKANFFVKRNPADTLVVDPQRAHAPVPAEFAPVVKPLEHGP